MSVRLHTRRRSTAVVKERKSIHFFSFLSFLEFLFINQIAENAQILVGNKSFVLALSWMEPCDWSKVPELLGQDI